MAMKEKLFLPNLNQTILNQFILNQLNLIQYKIILFIPLFIIGTILLMPGKGFCFQVKAQVDKTRITSEDTISLQVVVDGGKAQVDTSPISDFKILSSGTSTSRSYINGQWQHQVVYRYFLIPNKIIPKKTIPDKTKSDKIKQLVIPPLKVSWKRQILMTEKILILMSDQPRSLNEPRKIFAKASVSNPTLVVGQQVIYTFRLFAAAKFARASLDAPGFDSFTAKEVEDRKNYTQTINGVNYLVNEINYILQAEKAGRFDIEPAVVMADLVMPSGNDSFDSFFNNSFFSSARTKPMRIASNPITLEVASLPSYVGGKPFSGLVGQFAMEAVMDKTTLGAGESATLTITIQGRGNTMDIGPPQLDLDPGQVKVYDDAPVEEMIATAEGFSGKKIFKRALVPRHAGTLVIPSIFLTYFDVQTREYKTISTDKILLDVTPGEPTLITNSSPNNGTGSGSGILQDTNQQEIMEKQEVVIMNKDILDIKDKISILSSSSPWFGFPVFILLLLVPGLLYGSVLFIFRLQSREKSIETMMGQKAAHYLKKAGKLAGENKVFLDHLQAGLTAAIMAKGEKKGESLTRDEARQILKQAGTGQDLIDEVIDMLEAMDAARFGGQTLDKKKAGVYLGRVKQAIKMLCVALWCVGIFTLNPRAVQAQDMTGFYIDGIKQYQAGEFKAAAKSFETIAKSNVINPDLYYNIGNSYLKANDLGHAILWYERAKLISPGDPDLLFNLTHADTLVKDKIDSSVTMADILFFWQGIVPLKWIQAGAIFSSCLFFLWAGIQTFRQKRIFSSLGWIFISLLVFLTLAAGLEYYRVQAVNQAVIVQDKAAVRSGILETSTKLFELHAGTRVRVRAKKDGYLKIMLTRGKVGWVKPGDAEVI
jgi:tetratricopeptide (TPR) repeat protein